MKKLRYLEASIEDQLTYLIASIYEIRLEMKKLKKLDKTMDRKYSDLFEKQEECRKQLNNIKKNLQLLKGETK